MDKGFWMPKGGGPMTDGDAFFGNFSNMEPKRARQWFTDATETELFSNKRQTVESPIGKPSTGISMSSALQWDYSSQFIDRLFGPDMPRSVSTTERNMPNVGTDGSSMRKKVADEQFENDSSVGLSISYGVEDPETCVSYGGIRKVKVNQVNKDSESGLLATLEQNLMNMGSTDAFISVGERNGNDNGSSTSHSYKKGESKTISFGGYQDESVLDALGLERPIGNYSVLYEQSSLQTSEIPSKKAMDISNANAATANTSQPLKSRADSTSKNKSETKPSRKEAPNSFPSNVRSLIATGMLDGVPVRYVSVSREELRGVIQGSGYLCGCQTCQYSKALNAYEFERHAGCKTKHPNNHIYFENGKTIYQIVQELRSTPESMLFDAIQTVTGSPINQKAFRMWKESFQAATRELQRIYGKEALNL